jgi:hypothetical protein
MRLTILLLAGCSLPILPLAAALEPSLGIAVPLTQEGESVVLAQDIILNKTETLPAGTVLRTCFQPPPPDDKAVRKKESRERLERTFSRKPIDVSSKDNEMTAYKAVLKELAFSTVWTDPDFFRGYFHKITHDRYYLVYQRPGATQPGFSQFFFPEGLFLAAGDGCIEVLAVETGSRAEEAGFLAGDQIHAFNGIETGSDLQSFLPRYVEDAKSRPGGNRFLTFSVTTPENPEPFARKIPLPMSINADPFGPLLD